MTKKKHEHPLPVLQSDDFGAVLNCAVRYAIGRETYMPSIVIEQITPLLPYLSDRTLWCFDQDITEQRYTGGYGDPKIDEPGWLRFHETVRAERTRRGHELYETWRSPEQQERSRRVNDARSDQNENCGL